MTTTIPDKSLAAILDLLDKANVGVAERFPGDSSARQPVHVVYGGAHLFNPTRRASWAASRCARSRNTRPMRPRSERRSASTPTSRRASTRASSTS